MTENHEELMDSKQAVDYLIKKWGIESYSLGAFRALRFRWKIQPALAVHAATFYRKSDLDKIPKPDRKRKRGSHKKDEGNASGSSMILSRGIMQKRRGVPLPEKIGA